MVFQALVCVNIQSPNLGMGPVKFSIDPSTTCEKVLRAWADACGLHDVHNVRLYTFDGEGFTELAPTATLRALLVDGGVSGGATCSALTLSVEHHGVYLPPRLLPALSPRAPSSAAVQALEVLAPRIYDFAVSRPMDISRFALVCKAWSQHAHEQHTLAMLDLDTLLPKSKDIARAAMSLISAAKWPAGVARARINDPIDYTYIKHHGGQDAAVSEAVHCVAVHIAGLTFVHVQSSWAWKERRVSSDGLYVVRREGDVAYPHLYKEVCHLQKGDLQGCWVNVPVWASLRGQLLSCLPRLSELRDAQLLLLLFKAADMQRRDSRAEQAALYTQICRSFENLEWLPSYPPSDRPHDMPPPPAGPEGQPELLCEDGTALGSATERCWTEGLFALHGVYTALRNVIGMGHLSTALQLAKDFHTTQVPSYDGPQLLANVSEALNAFARPLKRPRWAPYGA